MDEYFNTLQNQIAQNNAWSAEQAQKQMDFQERMSNTAHQREIEDLKAAGLNPVLSAKLGGASTPSGAMSTADPSGTAALVELMTKFLDVEAQNAKAIQAASGSKGAGSGSIASSAKTYSAKDSTNDINGLLQLLGLGGMSKDAKGLINSMYDYGDDIADALGIPESSPDRKNLRDYLTGNWSLEDSINVIKDLFRQAKDKVNTYIDDNNGGYDSYLDYLKDLPNKFKGYVSEDLRDMKDGKNTIVNAVVNTVKNAATKVGNAVSNIVNKSSQLSKDSFTSKVSSTKAKLYKSKM